MLKFTKMTGLGNDYIYINCMNDNKIDNVEDMSKILSDRHFGIGADGIILIENSDVADFKMRIFNSDGSEAEMCGNGIRCVGKYVYDNKLTDEQEISIETLAGIKKLKLLCDSKDNVCEAVEVDMGEPSFKGKDLPVSQEDEINKDIYIGADGKDYRFTVVSMGNPHAVTFVEDINSIPIDKIRTNDRK